MPDIFSFYAEHNESVRLTRDRLHQSEYLVMLHLLRRCLGSEPLRVLDCCAGCGIYSTALAEMGHTVTAGDLIPAHAAYMRAHCMGLAEIYEGDCLDLSRFPDGSFDAVLNFGAMYHLQDWQDRDRAMREGLRVLRRGGVFAYTYETPEALALSQFMDAYACPDPAERVRRYRELDECRRTHCRGVFYGMPQEEIAERALRFALEPMVNACIYCTFYPFLREIDDWTEEAYRQFVDTLIAVCEEETVVRNAMHGVFFGRKTRD